MVPRRKSGRTSLGIHLTAACKRNVRASERAGVPFDPSRAVGVIGMHGTRSELSYESIISRRKEDASEEERKKTEVRFCTSESADLASRAGADVEGCSGFS